jgi:hypothetical protein
VALAATPLSAQTAPPEPLPGAIIVPGKREIDRAIVEQNIEQLTTRVPVLNVVPRFYQPLCLHVLGPDLAVNRIIAERITEAARAAGLKKPKPTCRENALVIIVDDPKRLYDKLVQRGHGAVSAGDRDVSVGRLRSELKSGKPAIAWNRTAFTRGGVNFVNVPADIPEARTPAGPRIVSNIYRSKVLSVVIFDSTKIGNATPTQLGDYAALHLLTTPRRNIDFDAVSARTILSLFADGPDRAPEGMTAFDKAYLKGVHALGNKAFRGKVDRAVLDAYEAQCVDEDPDCQFVVPTDALPLRAASDDGG